VGQLVTAGGGKALVESGVGGAFTAVSAPSPGRRANALYGITAPASNEVWAVGTKLPRTTAYQTLIEVFDGASWRVVPSPNA
jgi:hypothetical protein